MSNPRFSALGCEPPADTQRQGNTLGKVGDYEVSAFLVSEKTLNRILSYLDEELARSAWLRAKFVRDLGVNVAGDWQTALGQKMWDLNQLSLGYRYGDPRQELWYHYSSVSCRDIQAYKSLQCWLYQCCEGDIPNDSKLYTFFDTVVSQHIAGSIIRKTPEYERAEWG
jgi:hypothetical protein